MLAGDNNGLWREFFEISFEFSIVLFESITKTLYHARNTLLTVYKSVVVVFSSKWATCISKNGKKKFIILILLASASIALKEKKIIASWVVD